MFTSQISKALRTDAYARRYFDGVFPCDQLPGQLPLYPSAVVANTDPVGEPGKHWIAFYFNENKHLDYFDSYGSSPETYPKLNEFANLNSSTIVFNDRQLQGNFSDVCGHYCIAFIVMRARGYSLEYIMDYYSSAGQARPGEYDAIVASEVNNAYKIKRLDNINHVFSLYGGSGVGGKEKEQCCCCRLISPKE